MTLADLAQLNREILAEAEAKAAANAEKLSPSSAEGNDAFPAAADSGGVGAAVTDVPSVRLFANTRNAAAGSLRLTLSSPAAAASETGGTAAAGAGSLSRRRLSFFAYGLLDAKSGAPLAGGQVSALESPFFYR